MDFLRLSMIHSVATKCSPTKVMDISIKDDLTTPLMEKMKHESAYMVDRLVEQPYIFFCILALSAFLIIGFILHICWRAEASSGWRVQEWFCNGTSRQHRWRALHTLHTECLHEELFQKPASKMKGGIYDETRNKEEGHVTSLLPESDKPYAIKCYGAIGKLDHV